MRILSLIALLAALFAAMAAPATPALAQAPAYTTAAPIAFM